MKNKKLLPLIALGAGGLGLALRYWFLHGGRDEDGLLATLHPARILLGVAVLAVVICLVLLTRKTRGSGSYYDNFPKSIPGGVCAILAAVCLFFLCLTELIGKPDGLTRLSDFLGLAAVFALGFTGFCRIQKRRPNFLFHTVICLFFALRLICQYRSWSSNPQLAEYDCELLATVCLMLYAYHRAAFDLNLGVRRSLELWGTLGVFFCILCLAGTGFRALYLTMGAWLLTGLCTPEDPSEDAVPKEEMPEDESTPRPPHL